MFISVSSFLTRFQLDCSALAQFDVINLIVDSLSEDLNFRSNAVGLIMVHTNDHY